MIGSPACRHAREALGVYVLGAIDPAERASVDEHLAVCVECREELASLAGLPALLRRIPSQEAERLLLASPDDHADGPSPELLDVLLARAAGVRRTQRWRRLAAAAAVVAFALGGGAALANLTNSGSSSPGLAWRRTVTVFNRATGAELTVKSEPEPWGTRLDVQAHGVTPGNTCQIMVGDSSGAWWPAGSWLAERYSSQSGWFPASAAVRWRDVSKFKLLVDGQVVAQVNANTS